MTGDQYVAAILQKYAVNVTVAQKRAQDVAPAVQRWAGSQLANLEYSGSLAKGTANNVSTDVDLFISLKSDTRETLKEIYESLFTLGVNRFWFPRRQNVSIGITSVGTKMDLVPGKTQSGYLNRHSIYKRSTDSWTQTNVRVHIDTVKKSQRTREIRAVKIWRTLHDLSFPSFYLELFVIEALKGRSTTNLSENVLHALNYIANNLPNNRILDPANTNNVVSDDLTIADKNAVARQARTSVVKQYWEHIIW